MDPRQQKRRSRKNEVREAPPSRRDHKCIFRITCDRLFFFLLFFLRVFSFARASAFCRAKLIESRLASFPRIRLTGDYSKIGSLAPNSFDEEKAIDARESSTRHLLFSARDTSHDVQHVFHVSGDSTSS